MESVTPKISVIVPVYNVERYLPRCIDSILVQTFTDFELLLVDDGSTDGSGAICDEYANLDSRVRVFHKENGGVASARQIGVDKAVGEYSIHADGDDWVEPEMLGEMYRKAEESQSDILIADFYVDRKGKERYVAQKAHESAPIEILQDILTGNLFGALWHKLIRHSLYKKHNVHFVQGVDYCEDVLVLAQFLQLNVNVVFLHEAFYHYDQQNADSITRIYNRQTFLMRMKFAEELASMLPKSFGKIIDSTVFQIKCEAFSHGVLLKQDLNKFMPICLSDVLFAKYSKRIKVCMIFVYFGLFNFANNFLRVRLTNKNSN